MGLLRAGFVQSIVAVVSRLAYNQKPLRGSFLQCTLVHLVLWIKGRPRLENCRSGSRELFDGGVGGSESTQIALRDFPIVVQSGIHQITRAIAVAVDSQSVAKLVRCQALCILQVDNPPGMVGVSQADADVGASDSFS